MNKKLIALLLGTCLLFALVGCSVSHSSSSSSTVSSTVNGETTTITTTTENGETHTETTTTSADGSTVTTVDGQTVSSENAAGSDIVSTEDDPTGLRAKWHEIFTAGAEGSTEDGVQFFFACDDPESVTFAAMMIVSQNGKSLDVYDYGKVLMDENNKPYIEDVEGESTLPFEILETNDTGFVAAFQNGVQVQFHHVDQDNIINDMISIWEGVQAGTVAYDGGNG